MLSCSLFLLYKKYSHSQFILFYNATKIVSVSNNKENISMSQKYMTDSRVGWIKKIFLYMLYKIFYTVDLVFMKKIAIFLRMK